jgi:hypothetical protein
MLYLIVEMSVLLVLAALVGTTVGWNLSAIRARSRAAAGRGTRTAASAPPAELAALRTQLAELNARARAHATTLDDLRREGLELLQLATGGDGPDDHVARWQVASAAAGLFRSLGLRRRMAPRVPLVLRAVVQSRSATRITRTVDLSPCGALVEDPGGLATGTVLDFTLELPDELGVVEGQARVVRVDRSRPGAQRLALQFTEVSASAAETVARLLAAPGRPDDRSPLPVA